MLYFVQLGGTGTTFLTQIMRILLTASSAGRVTTPVSHPGQEPPATLRQRGPACQPLARMPPARAGKALEAATRLQDLSPAQPVGAVHHSVA